MTQPQRPRLRAVLFDLDGTLVDSEREHVEALARALADGQAITIDQADRDFAIGRSWRAIDARLRARYPQLGWSFDELIAATAARRPEVFAASGLTVLPGAREAIDRVADAGLAMALVTGSARGEAEELLAALRRRDRFEVVVAAEDVPRSKPAPDGYLRALAQLGVPAEGCVVVEDSEVGIAAGRAAGCRVIAVAAGNFHGQDQSGADVQLLTLAELGDALGLVATAARPTNTEERARG